MSKSSRRFGLGRSSGTVTVIEQKVHRSSARNARFAFVISVIVVGLLALTVASDYMHPILAGLLAAPIATFVGALVWVLVRVWPVLRILWWWSFEITASLGLVYGWVTLANATPAAVTLAILAPLVGVPAAVPALRCRVVAISWCVIVRHRLRVCFSQFIIANRTGSLPLILWARPTPVGERVWVYLRPGLSLSRLQSRLDEIAVTCHATSAVVELAGSSKRAAFLRFDIKRREVLTADVNSTLPTLVPAGGVPTPAAPGAIPTALDLPDVPAEPTPTAPAVLKAASSANGKRPTTTKAAPAAENSDFDPWD
ncbi:hypothetical protein [Couchioplanes azureus]|uniref:hypothetical protein n=1 Tax=Couchioplanes caeruleus TaxID=56438 RepID=UPI0016701A07|nr:hypothetical protein [Couchioplanes caeruleus]GGQ86703.1 hypothetical protein GCM10010166_66060 [Couchioplanes caeruleus subsp. azureus]